MTIVFSLLVNRDGSILRANGASAEGLGRTPASLIGSSIFLIFPKRLHGIIRTLLRRMSYEGSLNPLNIPVIHNKVGCTDMFVRAIPSDLASVWMDFSSDGTGLPLLRPGIITAPDASDSGETGVSEKEEFLESVERRVSRSSRLIHDLTMFDFSGQLDPSGEEAGKAKGHKSIRSALESTLSRWSVDGEIGYLKPGCYAILHSAEIAADDIVAAIPQSLQEKGIEDEIGTPFTETIHLDTASEPTQNVRGLLTKIVDGFTRKAGSLFRKTKLYTTFSKIVPRLKNPARLVRQALDEDRIAIAETGVVSIESGQKALGVARGQLQIDDELIWIGDLVDLTSCAELCVRHDLVVVQHVLRNLKDGRYDRPIVVEIARPSIFDRSFSRAIKSACVQAAVADTMFGIKPVGLSFSDTHSPGFEHFCDALGHQHPVWLSNFPSAITSIDKLTKMRTEYIELPLGLLKSLSNHGDAETMGRLVQVWRNVATHVVITGLHDPQSALIARQAGVDFGAGSIYDC